MSIEMWHSWHNGGRPQAGLSPMLASYKPYIDREVGRWSSSGIPGIVLESEAKQLAIGAIKSFDPKQGAQLQTHIVNHLKGLDRFVNTYREDVRLPIDKVHLANKVHRAKMELEAELGREVTLQEISQRSGIGPHTIGSLKRFQSGLYSSHETSGANQPVKEDISHQQIVAEFLHHDLSPKQKLVFEYSTGFKGKQVLSPGEIAKKLNVSPARVSILKNEIATKARRYQGAVNSLMS